MGKSPWDEAGSDYMENRDKKIEEQQLTNLREVVKIVNKNWIEWIEKFISYSEEGRKESIAILWEQWEKRKKEVTNG